MPKMYGWVREVVPESLADRAGLQPGDLIRTINGHLVRDLVDYRFYSAEEELTISFARQEHEQEVHIVKTFDENLGVLFGEEPAPFIRQCANKCVFCFIKGLPERFAPQPGLAHGMRASLYIKDDDYRYSFLFGNFITLTNLKERDWQRLDEQKLTPLYVSVHTTDPELRRRMVDGPRAGEIIEHIQRLGSMHLTCHTQLVLCPTINDGPHLDSSIREEAEVIVDQVEHYQRHFAADNADGGKGAYVEAERNGADIASGVGEPFAYLSDEWYYLTKREFPSAKHYGSYAQIENGVGMTRYLIDQWARTKQRLPTSLPNPRRVTLVTGTMALPVIRELAEDMSKVERLEVQILPVVNQFFGAEVTVAGLLCGHDVLAALEENQNLGDLVLLPRVMLNNEGVRFLDDLTVAEFKQRVPVQVEFVRNAQETIEAIRLLGVSDTVDALSSS